MKEEEGLQEAWTYAYLEGMASYSCSSSVPSGLDQSWAQFLPRQKCQRYKSPTGQEFARMNARLLPLRPPIQGLFLLQIEICQSLVQGKKRKLSPL